MTELQPLSQLQETDELSLNVQEMQFWLDKAVAWGQADSPDTRKDTCRHLSRLRNFLQQILTQINNMSSTVEITKKFPLLGQFLGRLCWNPYVTVGETSRQLLFQCILGLYTEHPSNAVERKANQWIQKVLCQLATEDDVAVQALTKHMGVPAKEYHVKVLKKMVMRLKENVENNHSSQSEANQSSSKCEVKLELSFEYLMSKDRLQWVTITSQQAIMMSICLQAMVDELMVKKSGGSIKKLLKKRHNGSIHRSDSQQAVKSPPLLDSPDPNRDQTAKLSTKLNSVSLRGISASNSANDISSDDFHGNYAFEGIGDDDL